MIRRHDVEGLRAAVAAYDTRAAGLDALAFSAGYLRQAAKGAVDAWDMGGGDADALRRQVARLEDELHNARGELRAVTAERDALLSQRRPALAVVRGGKSDDGEVA